MYNSHFSVEPGSFPIAVKITNNSGECRSMIKHMPYIERMKRTQFCGSDVRKREQSE